jgi:hypothetical protein
VWQVDSFGNCTRIDYGTGHETTFVAWLYCLSTLGVFSEQDRIALVSHVFLTYLTVMRKLQTTYWLEPAGALARVRCPHLPRTSTITGRVHPFAFRCVAAYLSY